MGRRLEAYAASSERRGRIALSGSSETALRIFRATTITAVSITLLTPMKSSLSFDAKLTRAC